jgi:hypothetical protein
MRIDHLDPEQMYITLSRRNLLTLLAKLDGKPASSLRTIYIGGGDQPLLVVTAEDDDTHYGSRGCGPGPMHQDTERAIGSIDRERQT